MFVFYRKYDVTFCPFYFSFNALHGLCFVSMAFQVISVSIKEVAADHRLSPASKIRDNRALQTSNKILNKAN